MFRENSHDIVNLTKNEKNVVRSLTKELRDELKNPQGLLIEGSFKKTMNNLKVIIERESPSLVISVGDIVSKNMIEYGILLNILIVDNKTMRKPIQPINVDVDQLLYAKNPPGTITNEALAVIKRAIDSEEQTMVIIEGEEDLLTLATVLVSPINTFVVYGQPHTGIVLVRVTEESKEKMQQIVKRMIKSSKS